MPGFEYRAIYGNSSNKEYRSFMIVKVVGLNSKPSCVVSLDSLV
jgi:hypothetical protein